MENITLKGDRQTKRQKDKLTLQLYERIGLMADSLTICLHAVCSLLGWVGLGTWAVCPRCYRKSQNASKKALLHPKDDLERSQSNTVNPGPCWTRQKRLEAFQTSNK